MKLKALILLSLFLFGFGQVKAQLNFVVGYNAGSVLQSENNKILQQFNSLNNTTITEPFKELKFLTGLELGFRYNFNPVALTMGFSTMRRKRSSTQLLPLDQVSKNILNYSFGTYSVGVETGLEKIRIGTSMGFRRVKIKSKIGSTSDFETLVSRGNWVSKFYLTIAARGNDFNSIAIRPYFDFAWNETIINELNSHLGITPAIRKDPFHTFGVTIIFYNGPQNL